jgi:hypothetical protein
MNEKLAIHPDVLALAVAMLGNPEAFKQATRLVEHECYIKTDPVQKIVEWSLSMAAGLNKGQNEIDKG